MDERKLVNFVLVLGHGHFARDSAARFSLTLSRATDGEGGVTNQEAIRPMLNYGA